MEGFWVETQRGLETLNPGFLREFILRSVPNLKPEIAKELSMACFHILWDRGPRLVPWTLDDLTGELSSTLIALGQIRLARILSGAQGPLPGYLLDDQDAQTLEPLEGAIHAGFLELGQLFKGRMARIWRERDSESQELQTGETLILEAPEPTWGKGAIKQWLAMWDRLPCVAGQSLWVVCDWMIGPDPSLFSQVSIEEQQEIARALYAGIFERLGQRGGPKAACLVPRQVLSPGRLLARTMPLLPEGTRLGLIPAAQGPGRTIVPLFARGELDLDYLVRSRSPWSHAFREWVAIVHRIRRYWGKKVAAADRDRLPRTVRWVLKGWTHGPGRPVALAILREMSRLVPAEDEVCLGLESEIPSDPAEFYRWAHDPAILQSLEECRWNWTGNLPEGSAPSLWSFRGVIWIENPNRWIEATDLPARM